MADVERSEQRPKGTNRPKSTTHRPEGFEHHRTGAHNPAPAAVGLIGASGGRLRLALAVLVIPAILIVGFIGYYRYHDVSVLSALYETLALFRLGFFSPGDHPIDWQLQLARYLALVLTAFALAVAGGVLFRRQVDSVRARYRRRHTVICGLGATGGPLALTLLAAGTPVIAIETDPLNRYIGPVRDKHGIVLEADALNASVLRNASLRHADYLVCATGDDMRNLAVAAEADRVTAHARRGGRLSTHAQITDLALCHLFREAALLRPGTDEGLANLDLDFYNTAENSARQLIDKYCPRPDAHVVIVHLDDLGAAVLLQLVHRAIRSTDSDAVRPTVTVIGPDASARWRSLCGRDRALETGCVLTTVDVPLDWASLVSDSTVMSTLAQPRLDAVFVCPSERSSALELARRFSAATPAPVLVPSADADLIMALLAGYENLVLFDPATLGSGVNLLLHHSTEWLARGIHENYRRTTPESATAALSWDELGDDLREANRSQARAIVSSLRSCGYDALSAPTFEGAQAVVEFPRAQLEHLAQVEHARWVAQRRSAGWTYVAGVRNDATRTHPDLVPWDELSPEVQDKDRDAVRGWPQLLYSVGYQVVTAAPAGD